jgi:hypothetical protein
MYESSVSVRRADRQWGVPPRDEVADRALVAMTRVRNLLVHFTPGLVPSRDRLLSALETPLADSTAERERLALRGWLLWWNDDFTGAEAVLAPCVESCLACDDKVTLALAAYWLARVRLRLRKEAITAFESALRKMGGTPQATAWFVDLLWRAGRSERAEQVWKSVRGNKRVAACIEGDLLEARLQLQREDWAAAEKTLQQMIPSSGPVDAERHYLLCWLYLRQKKTDLTKEHLSQAEMCPYPESARQTWRGLVESGSFDSIEELAPAWMLWLAAQQRREQQVPSADLYREAATVSALKLAAHYGLVMEGAQRAAELLPGVISPFWGIRLRAHQAIERFTLREIGPESLLETFQAAHRAGYNCAAIDHFRRLAEGDYHEALESTGDARDNAALLALEHGKLPPDAQLSPRVLAELNRSRMREALAHPDTASLTDIDHPDLVFFSQDWPSLIDRFPTLRDAVALHAAAERGDLSEALRLFQGQENPPEFVLQALQALWIHRPTEPAWSTLPLPWPTQAPAMWWLYQAARAAARQDYRSAWLAASQAQAAVAPALQRLAWAQSIAEAYPLAQLEPERLLALVTQIQHINMSESVDVLRSELEAIQDAPRDVRHSLAVLFWRSLRPESLDKQLAQRAWEHWLAIEPPAIVVEYLLQWHQQAMVDCFAQKNTEAARRHWDVLHCIPALQNRMDAFRDSLATQLLVHCREVIRHAEAPPGFQADYERGLLLLRQLLSLDRDNIRLLTAMLEICSDWFLDYYHAEDTSGLREQVVRHRPFAEHLSRLTAQRRGEVAAQRALSEFWKLRGFVESDPEAQLALYREALAFDPTNENVKQLLEEMQGKAEPRENDDA